MRIKDKLNAILKDKKRLFLAIIFLAVLIRLIFVLSLHADGYYFSDTRHYDHAAKNLIKNQSFGEEYYRPPLYPIVMAGIYTIFGTSFMVVRIFEVLIGIVLCGIIFFIAREIFNDRVAFFALFLAAIHPHFIIICGILYPTNLFTCLLAVSLWIIIKKSKPALHGLFSGGIAGFAALTIPAMFFIIPFWLLWMFFQKDFRFNQKLLRLGLFVLSFILVLAPWTIHNYQRYNRITLVQNLPHTILPDFDNTKKQKLEIKSGFPETVKYFQEHPTGTDKDNILSLLLHYIKNPWKTLKHVFVEMKHFWALYPDRLDTEEKSYRHSIHQEDERMVINGQMVWKFVPIFSTLIILPIFVFAIIGFIHFFPWSSEQLLLLLTIVGISLGYSLIFSEVRYRIPVEPYILMFTSAGLLFIFKKLFDLKLYHTFKPIKSLYIECNQYFEK
jgi:4-amino-4-deoxy-L-arabinose transferase-like glycosyltransferase